MKSAFGVAASTVVSFAFSSFMFPRAISDI